MKQTLGLLKPYDDWLTSFPPSSLFPISTVLSTYPWLLMLSNTTPDQVAKNLNRSFENTELVLLRVEEFRNVVLASSSGIVKQMWHLIV